MREIKFRQPVWENGKIIRWCYWGYKDGLYQHPTNQHESNQFTGLLDKNGKEIYEGDILNFDFITCFSRTHGEIHEFAVASVVWVDTGAGFTLHIIKGHLHSLDITRGEVIGNIYENPELIQ